MTTWKTWPALLALAALAGLLERQTAVVAEAPPPPAPAGTLLVLDRAGKEQKLTSWKFVVGTRHLSWLAPPAKEGDPPAEGEKPRPGVRPRTTVGPEALEFRESEEFSTGFQEGILTLIPLDRLRSLDYEEDTVTAHVATPGKDEGDEMLTGSTKYRGINKLTIEAEVDKGDLGVAEVKFLGGVPKGIRGVRFPPVKGGEAPAAGRVARVSIAEKEKGMPQEVTDLQLLYRLADGSERLLPTLMFKKTLKIDVNKVQKLRAVEGKEGGGAEWSVTLKDGDEETYTLLMQADLGGKSAVLEGFLGRVPTGYKLFPVHTVAEIDFDDR